MSSFDFKAMEEPFHTLGLDSTATEEEINRHWRRLVRQIHPDKPSGNEEQTKIFNEARERAIACARDPSFREISHKRAERKKEKEEFKKRQEKSYLLFRMIDILMNEHNKLDANYDESIFKAKTRDWTPQQFKEAQDSVFYGLHNNRTILDELRSKLKSETERANQAEVLADTWKQKCAAQQQELKQMKKEHATLSKQVDQLQTNNNTEKHKADVAVNTIDELLREKQTLQQRLLELTHEQNAHEEAIRTLQASINEQKTRADTAEANLLRVRTTLETTIEQETGRVGISRSTAEELKDPSYTKKRKHVKHFARAEDETAFQNELTSFLRTTFQQSKHDFTSTQDMKKSFSSYTSNMPSDQTFFKHLKNQIQIVFPSALSCEKSVSGKRYYGYLGIKQHQ